jgi:hypothetical protein
LRQSKTNEGEGKQTTNATEDDCAGLGESFTRVCHVAIKKTSLHLHNSKVLNPNPNLSRTGLNLNMMQISPTCFTKPSWHRLVLAVHVQGSSHAILHNDCAKSAISPSLIISCAKKRVAGHLQHDAAFHSLTFLFTVGFSRSVLFLYAAYGGLCSHC